MIQRRFVAYFVVLALLAVGAVVTAEYRLIDSTIEDTYLHNRMFAGSVSRTVGGRLLEHRRAAEALVAGLPAALTPGDDDLRKLVSEHRGKQPGDATLTVYDHARRTVAADNHPAGAAPPDVLMPALRAAERAGNFAVTDLWWGMDEEPRVSVVVGAGEGRTWRAVVADVRLRHERFARVFEHLQTGPSTRLQLLDASGRALASTDADDLYKSAVHGTYFSDGLRRGNSAQMRCHSCHVEKGKRVIRQKEFATVAAVAGTSWCVVVRRPEERVFGSLKRGVLARAALFSVLAGALLGFLFLLYRRVIRPMRVLAEAASAAIAPVRAEPEALLQEVDNGDAFKRLARSVDLARRRRRTSDRILAARPPSGAWEAVDPEAPARRTRELLAEQLKPVVRDLVRVGHARCALLVLCGGPLSECVVLTQRIKLGAGVDGEKLHEIGDAGPRLLVDDLVERGHVLKVAEGTRAFLAARFDAGDGMRGQLWMGMHSTSAAVHRTVAPTVELLTALVASAVERTMLYRALGEGREDRGRLLSHVFETEASERERFAARLDRGVLEALKGMHLRLEKLPEDAPRAAIDAALEDLGGEVADAVADVERLVHLLRPAVLDEQGLFAAVEALGANILEPRGIAFECSHEGSDGALPRRAAYAVFRALQEAAYNVVRHAEAGRVRATVRIADGSLAATLEDDGRGMDTSWMERDDARPRWGLVGMQARVVRQGGELQFTTAELGGVKVSVTVPVATA